MRWADILLCQPHFQAVHPIELLNGTQSLAGLCHLDKPVQLAQLCLGVAHDPAEQGRGLREGRCASDTCVWSSRHSTPISPDCLHQAAGGEELNQLCLCEL